MPTRQGKKLLALSGSICLVLVLVALPFISAPAKAAPKQKAGEKWPNSISMGSRKMGTSSYIMMAGLAEMLIICGLIGLTLKPAT
jgi:hypothetical protein